MEFLKDFFKVIWIFDFEEKWGNFNYDFFGKESENFIGGYNEKNKRYKEDNFNKKIMNNYYSNKEKELYKSINNIYEKDCKDYNDEINSYRKNKLLKSIGFNKNISDIFLEDLGFKNIDAINIREDILKSYYKSDGNIYYKGNLEDYYDIESIYDYKIASGNSKYEKKDFESFEKHNEKKIFEIFNNYKYDIKNENIRGQICKNDNIFYDKSDIFEDYGQCGYDYFNNYCKELFSNVFYGNNFENKNDFYNNEFCYDIFNKNDFGDLNNYENHKFESNRKEKIVNMINNLYANKEKDISDINEKIYSEKMYKESTDYINTKEKNIFSEKEDTIEKIKEELMNGLLGAEGVYII